MNSASCAGVIVSTPVPDSSAFLRASGEVSTLPTSVLSCCTISAGVPAGAIAAKSPLAIAGSKLALNYAVDHPTADALEQMTLLQSAIFDIDEMQRAIAGWKAKREAGFDPLAPVERV